jgi:hypothetical protein
MTMVLTLVKRLQKLAQYGMTKNNCSHNKTISKSLAVAGFFVYRHLGLVAHIVMLFFDI